MVAKKKAQKSPPTKTVAKKPGKRVVARPSAKASTKRRPKARASRAKTGVRAKTIPPKPTKNAEPTKSAKPTKKRTAPAPKRRAATKVKPKAPIVARRDRAGHIDPVYAADLRAKSLEGRGSDDDNVAFLRGAHSNDDLAEELGEEAVSAMTSGEDEGEEALEQVVDEERGGPFIESTAGKEFAEGTDESNPHGATREPFPKT